MRRTYWKSLWRGIWHNLGRFLAVFGIILISTLLISGLGTLGSTVKASFNQEMIKNKFPDIILKSKVALGFTTEEKNMLLNQPDIDESRMEEIYFYDTTINNTETRIIYRDYQNMKINPISIVEGNLPTSDTEVAVEQLPDNSQRKIGDTFEITSTVPIIGTKRTTTFTVVGIVHNPMNNSIEKDKSQTTQKDVHDIFYMNSKKAMSYISGDTLFIGPDIYIQLSHDDDIDYFSNDYVNKVVKRKNQLITMLTEKRAAGLTVEESVSYQYLNSTIDKVQTICTIFPAFFIVVAALVSSITIERLINEERGLCACFKTLGYSNHSIRFRYVFFSLLSSLNGAIIGSIGGLFGLPSILYPTFQSIVIDFPKMKADFNPSGALLGSGIIILVILIITLVKINKDINETPADSLRPKSPVIGKKILIERIDFFWKPLPFRYKATLRNIFRFKSKTITMNLSVMCSIALVMAGFGILDLASNWENTSAIMETFKSVASFIIIFAVILAILVIYNLVNINVSERVREISTLEVLGYKPKEVYTYVFREIIIMGVTGEVLGIPLGVLLLYIITSYLDFGSISVINAGTYIYSLLLGFATLIIVCALMIPKIKKINMITSLKTLE